MPAMTDTGVGYDRSWHAVRTEIILCHAAQIQAKNCVFRLLNILLSDDFAPRFAEVGNTSSRQQLDVRDVNGSSSFWRDVVVENNTNRWDYNGLLRDYNGLLSVNARFAAIDLSTIVIHDMATMYDMWKTVTGKT
ncbi:LOW QUALITY PROTEIN: hypothetical protein PHMEG_0009553 [Phytophthora megakarya]|uniref:Uncharacterized protein n=1 Tax=Phytophthora megakarya TaxID=4795 RepID=A0A225WHB0_9STRA|nr:LOW QUALITY PROTEIN: hypothetical protein PHMEG_0009553 [Phytophthora megakarya]